MFISVDLPAPLKKKEIDELTRMRKEIIIIIYKHHQYRILFPLEPRQWYNG